MSETQFIAWLKAFLNSRGSDLSAGDVSTIQMTLNMVRPNVNESTNSGKQILHG